jgi:fructose-specific component phosphotransferase system IIB-like protein
LEKDAVSAGVNNAGGLFSTAEVRILICYILSSLGEAVPGKLLADTLHYEGIANCFEVNDSIVRLVENGQLRVVDEAEDTYIITESGKYVANTLKTTLSLTVKQRAYDAAYKMLARFKNAKETDIKISREDNKIFITCSAIDNKTPFMSVKLLVSDEEQAVHIKEKFLSDPTKIYSSLIDLLTK